MTATHTQTNESTFNGSDREMLRARPRGRKLWDGELMASAADDCTQGTAAAPSIERRPPVRRGRAEGRRASLAGDIFGEERLSLEPPRILLAEDHAETRVLLACMLRADGYQVTEAASGYDLLDEIATVWLTRYATIPDLIITDVRMPGPTGLRVLDALRASNWALPVIVITAFGDAETHTEARRLGAHAVLDKPFELDRLRTTVAEVLNP